MNDKTLSVVIPTYNMEKYLNRCVDSLLVPAILPKIEILIVNDGSKDNSLAIAREYETNYPASVKVIDKPNGNYGSCINAALKVASGKYFRILDADDWFDSANFVQLINSIEHIDTDMVITNFSKEHTDGHSELIVKNTGAIPTGKVCNFDEYDFQRLGVIYLLSMHSLTYRTQLLRDIDYRQTEGISYTDTEYCFYPLAYARSFIFFDFVLYQYYFGHEGQTVSLASVVKSKDHYYKIIIRMLDYLGTGGESKNPVVRKQQYAIVERIAKCYYAAILIYSNKNNDDEMKLQNINNKIQELDKDLYNRLANDRYHGTEYIRYWRDKGVYYSNPGQFVFNKLYIRLRHALKRNRILSSMYRKINR